MRTMSDLVQGIEHGQSSSEAQAERHNLHRMYRAIDNARDPKYADRLYSAFLTGVLSSEDVCSRLAWHS